MNAAKAICDQFLELNPRATVAPATVPAFPETIMKRPHSLVLTLAASAAVASLPGIGPGHAQNTVDKAKAAAFDNRMFAGPIGEKTYACFVRRYDANHLAQHPKQKVSR